MKEIFQEYGGVIITIVAVLALVTVIAGLVTSNEGGVVATAFNNLFTGFFTKANTAAGITATP